MMYKAILIMCAFMLPVVVCSAHKPLVISKNDAGKTLSVQKGVAFTIALEGNASTGFTWNIRELDTTMVKMAGSGRFVGRDTIPGTSGTFYLDFLPVGR
ncbi:MAG: protease inhibitor I42 family protein, partial [Chitinispirillaceae bacterium]|nr:protease inhibitor I42 family protein [Chitinispirillaceae bacterium]